MNQPWIYMCSPSWYPIPPPSPSHPSGSSQCTSPEPLSYASNLGWWSVSPLTVYLFQCCSLRTSHTCLLPQSSKVCSVHLCLFFCFAYWVIITIFLNSMYICHIYTMEYYSAVKKNSFESVLMRWMKLEPIIQSEVSQKDNHQYSVWLFWDLKNCSPPDSSVHGISQARILERVAISFSRGSSPPRDWIHVSFLSREIFYHLRHLGSL